MLFSAVDDYVWNRTLCTYDPSDCADEHILYCSCRLFASGDAKL